MYIHLERGVEWREGGVGGGQRLKRWNSETNKAIVGLSFSSAAFKMRLKLSVYVHMCRYPSAVYVWFVHVSFSTSVSEIFFDGNGVFHFSTSPSAARKTFSFIYNAISKSV